MKLKELIKESGFIDVKGDPEIEILGITIDSRKVKPGDLYICIPGTKIDGHAFAADAAAKGAAALAVEYDLPEVNIPQVRFKDCRVSFSKLAAAWNGFPAKKLSVIGITGTNGKTTTSYLMKSIFETAGQKVGLMGTIGTLIGDQPISQALTTPDPMELHGNLKQMLEAGCDRVVMEVSAHALALHKLDDLFYDAAVFSNLTQDHLDDFKTMERYRDAKQAFFTPKYTRRAIMNMDDASAEYMLKDFQGDLLTYSVNGKGQLTAQNLIVKPDSIRFDLHYENKVYPVKMQLTGHFNAYNALAAAGAALMCGVDIKTVIDGLEKVESMNGRMQRVDTGLDFTTVVDYAHTPDSLDNVIRAARMLTKKRVITVFGCGGDRDRTKRPIMGDIATRGSDLVIITSDNPRTEEPMSIMTMIEEGVYTQGAPYVMIADREQAIQYAMDQAQSEDIVLVAGKGHETYQDVMGVKRHFDDKEVVLAHAKTMK